MTQSEKYKTQTEGTLRIELSLLQLVTVNVRMMMMRTVIRTVMMIRIMTAGHVMKMRISTDSGGSLFALVWCGCQYVCVCACACDAAC